MKSIFIVIATLLETSSFAANNPYQEQYVQSVQHLLSNSLPNGALIASPSTVDPDYYFDWVRDTSLTMKTVIELSDDTKLPINLRTQLKQKIERWVIWELNRQSITTPTGLGEPKFYVNGSPYLEPWGRPQNDGPALRSIAAIKLANFWIQEGKFEQVKKSLYRSELPANTLIKRDLEYIAHHWQEPSFDLWEEEKGMHFYTLASQKLALIKGSELAKRLNDPYASDFYLTQAKAIDGYLKNFYDPNQKIIRYALNKINPLPHKKSDLDVAVLLASIQTYDDGFNVPVTEVITTVNELVSAFNRVYKINQQNKLYSSLGIALGRYPEDIYSGFDLSSGNPWFISTLALAEFSCLLKKSKKIKNEILEDISLKQFNRVLFHRLPDGHLSEQFNRNTGYQQGAKDLTWSYTAYITAYRACFN